MRNTKVLHYQMHRSFSTAFACRIAEPIVVRYSPLEEPVKISRNIGIDKFFDQPHNLRNGHVDTSPLVADSPDSITHFNPVDGERPLPADTPVDEIHKMVISKDCQSLADLNRLKDLRPDKSQFEDDEPAPVSEPAPVVESNVSE